VESVREDLKEFCEMSLDDDYRVYIIKRDRRYIRMQKIRSLFGFENIWNKGL
jgi:hypothetical protein